MNALRVNSALKFPSVGKKTATKSAAPQKKSSGFSFGSKKTAPPKKSSGSILSFGSKKTAQPKKTVAAPVAPAQSFVIRIPGPAVATMSRPQTAKSWRSSNSAYGAGLRPKSAYSGVKSRVYTPKRPASAPASKSKGRGADSGGTCTASRFIHSNGDKFAVMHPHKLSGYKLAEKHGENVIFHCGSTSREDFKAPSLSTIADPAKALYAYHPNARRSMLPIVFPHEAKKYVRYCHERNVSSFTIGDPNLPSEKASVHRAFHAVVDGANSNNPGILAEFTKRNRKKLGV